MAKNATPSPRNVTVNGVRVALLDHQVHPEFFMFDAKLIAAIVVAPGELTGQ